MTTKQFVKKYVAKDKRLEAEEQLDSMLTASEELGYEEMKNDVRVGIRGLSNEIGQW